MEQLLNVYNFNFYYGKHKVFDNLNFSISKGTINAIIGQNKCGKTTLIKILSGIIKTKMNFKFVDDSFEFTNDKKYISKINYFVFSNVLRFSRKTVNQNIYRWKENFKSDDKYFKTMLKEFDIENILDKKICNLSNIEFFKYVLLILMTKKPELLLLDDIFDGFSFYEYTNCINFMKKKCSMYNVTVLYTTNNLDKIFFCDNVIFLHDGISKLCGKPSDIFEHDNLLSRNGIYIPDMIDLSLKLKFYGLIDSVIMTPKEMVNKLWK